MAEGRSGDNEASKARFFTTHQAARLFGVSIPTVASWCDTGVLEFHRTPGGHRRIARDTLVAYAKERGVPLPREMSGGASRVLIVDDERDFAEMLSDYLVMKGFEVAVAHTAFQAGLELGRFAPALVLLDTDMPDTDAFEVLRVLREDGALREVRVLACTSFRDGSLDSRVARQRFDGFIEKPMKMSSLVDLIQRTLEQPAST